MLNTAKKFFNSLKFPSILERNKIHTAGTAKLAKDPKKATGLLNIVSMDSQAHSYP
jgi:hypothetical protein